MNFKKIKKIFPLCLASTMMLSFVPSANALNDVNILEGRNRVETSIKTALEQNAKVDYLILANGYSFADSLSSVNLLNHYENSKLILVTKNTRLTNELKKLKPKKVLLVGGADTLNGNFIKDIDNLKIPMERISGINRYETNKKTLEKYTRVGVADGRNYPDALSASALLKQENLGLMLVNGSKSYNTNKKVEYTFGDKESVKQDGGMRLSGNNRYITNEEINKIVKNKNNIITYGGNYADALSSVNLLNGNNKVILLNNKAISNYNKEEIKNGNNVVVGGLLSRDQISKIKDLSKPEEVSSTDNSGGRFSGSSGYGGSSSSSGSNGSNGSNGSGSGPVNESNKPPINDNNKIEEPIEDNITTGKIKTQRELDKYVLSRFVNGISEDGETVEIDNPNISGISPAVDYVLEDTGFKLVGNKNENKYTYYLKPSFFIEHCTDGKYNRTDFLNNLNHIRKNLNDSGALSKNNNYDKFRTFSLYIKKLYSYKFNHSDSIKTNSSSPYSLWYNGSASCLGYTYYNNLAAMLMKIPSFAVVGDNGDPNYYHAENMFLDENGQRHEINTTGISNYYNGIPEDALIGTLKPTLRNYYYLFNSGEIKDYDYFTKRKEAIKSDFYK